MSAEGPGPPPELTPEELAAAFAEQLARTPVRDLMLQTMATFTDMAGIRLGLGPAGDQARDLTQARQAIEALRALLEVADRELGPAQARPFREPLAALQMAYARAVERPARRGPAAARRPRRRAAATPASAAPRGRPGEPPLGAAGDPQAGRPAGLTWPSGRERRPVPCGRNRRRIGVPSGCRSLALPARSPDRAERPLAVTPISEGALGRLPVGQHNVAGRRARPGRRRVRHRTHRLPAAPAGGR